MSQNKVAAQALQAQLSMGILQGNAEQAICSGKEGQMILSSSLNYVLLETAGGMGVGRSMTGHF